MIGTFLEGQGTKEVPYKLVDTPVSYGGGVHRGQRCSRGKARKYPGHMSARPFMKRPTPPASSANEEEAEQTPVPILLVEPIAGPSTVPKSKSDEDLQKFFDSFGGGPAVDAFLRNEWSDYVSKWEEKKAAESKDKGKGKAKEEAFEDTVDQMEEKREEDNEKGDDQDEGLSTSFTFPHETS